MEILYDLTRDKKYEEDKWIFDPNKKLLWE